MDYANIYVERIRSLCETRSISINKLATMSNVKQSTLDNIMRGLTKNPRVKTLHKIASALETTLEKLFENTGGNPKDFDTEEKEPAWMKGSR